MGALHGRRLERVARLERQICGGGQQEGRRSGTLNVPGIIGFATALRICLEELPSEMLRLASLRNTLFAALSQQLANVQLCGPGLTEPSADGLPLRLPGNLNLSFGDVHG